MFTNRCYGEHNKITQQSASSSEELAATAEEMSSQAEQLQQLMAFFKVEAGMKAVAPSAPVAPLKAAPRTVRAVAVSDEAEFVRF